MTLECIVFGLLLLIIYINSVWILYVLCKLLKSFVSFLGSGIR